MHLHPVPSQHLHVVPELPHVLLLAGIPVELPGTQELTHPSGRGQWQGLQGVLAYGWAPFFLDYDIVIHCYN